MKWYEKKFSDFFRQWQKGDLLLQDKRSFFGQIDGFEISDKFEESKVTFMSYQPSGEESVFALKEIRHFHAYNGPILNIGKYVKIVKMGEPSQLSVIDGGKSKNKAQAGGLNLVVTNGTVVDEQAVDADGNRVICVAFGLEFYTNEKHARLFKQDAMQMLLSKFEETAPLLSVADHAPVDLTPTFTRWCRRIFGIFRRKQPKEYVGKHSPDENEPVIGKEERNTKT